MTPRRTPTDRARARRGAALVALMVAIASACSGPRGSLAAAGTTGPATPPTTATATLPVADPSAVASSMAPPPTSAAPPLTATLTTTEQAVATAQLPTEAAATTPVVTAAAPVPAGGATGDPAPGPDPTPAVRRTVGLGALTRSWLVVAPPVTETSRARPMVLLLHGLAADGKVLQGALGFDPLADGTDVVLAYPDAVEGAWNDERPNVTSSRAHRDHIDDVAFLDAIIDDAVAQNHVDPNRVAVVGFSNGGMMAAYYACVRSERVRAIAVVAGAGGAGLDGRCTPDRPVSVLAIHSRRDPVVPFLGGPIAADTGHWGNSAPVPTMLDRWRAIAGCQGIVDRVVSSGTPSVTEQHAYGCRPGTEIVLERVDSKVHGWLSDPTFMTTDIVWQFVVEHTLVPA